MIKINIIGKIPGYLGINRKGVNSIILEASLSFNLTGSTEIEIMFVNKLEIKNLNVKYRKMNNPTDVLSFPQSQFELNKKNILGSIVICAEVVAQKEEDIKDVLKHGLLHLLGYDHEIDEMRWDEAASKIDCKL